MLISMVGIQMSSIDLGDYLYHIASGYRGD